MSVPFKMARNFVNCAKVAVCSRAHTSVRINGLIGVDFWWYMMLHQKVIKDGGFIN